MADPWFKFYGSDWRSDPRLRMCSMAARGLWIEMIALMHEATPYGHLLVSGQSPTDTQLAVLVGAPSDQVPELLGELDAAGVFSRTREGVIYSRKMTRMQKKAATARNNGRKGGNPRLGKQEENPASDNPRDKGDDKPQKPEARDPESRVESLPSSGSLQNSSSSSARTHGENLRERVMAAAGLKSFPIPPHWMPPAADRHVESWKALHDLDEAEIIAVVEAEATNARAKNLKPANGPKAYDEAMERLGREKRSPRESRSPRSRADPDRSYLTNLDFTRKAGGKP